MAANGIDLTTVALVNAILNQGSDTDSTNIQNWITSYSKSILTRTGRRFLSGVRNYSERYNGSGSQEQALRNYPILAVSSLTINGIAIPAWSETQPSGYVIDTEGSQAFIALAANQQGFGWAADSDRWAPHSDWGSYGNAPPLGSSPWRFVQGIQNVAVSYTAGYTQDAYEEAQTVPATPGPYTVAVDNASTFYADEGVTLADGTVLESVTGTPGAGQYTPPTFGSVPRGTYTFNAAQQGASVLTSYSYGAVPFDLQEAAGRLVALQYRRRQWIGQTSQMQPGIGTTAYLKDEMELNTSGIIDRYRMRFLP